MRCPVDCEECDNEGNCSVCMKPFTMEKGVCKQEKCEKGFYLKERKCTAC